MKLINNLIASLVIGGLITGIVASIILKEWLYLFLFTTGFVFLKIHTAQYVRSVKKDKMMKTVQELFKDNDNDNDR